MIVVDSSVWIDTLRNADNPAVRKLRALGPDVTKILIGDVILLEVLQGARDAPHAARIERNLRRFSIAPMLDPDLAVRAAENYRSLRSYGITIRKTAALIIGTFCMARDHLLLHNDRDFAPMATHLGLRLA